MGQAPIFLRVDNRSNVDQNDMQSFYEISMPGNRVSAPSISKIFSGEDSRTPTSPGAVTPSGTP